MVLFQAIVDKALPSDKDLHIICDLAGVHPWRVKNAMIEGRILDTGITQRK
jgi:hypothetical protein